MDLSKPADSLNLIEQRFGNKMRNKKFMYGKAKGKTIYGVAWFVDKSIIKKFKTFYLNEVALLKPRTQASNIPVVKFINKDRKEQSKNLALVDV